MDQLLAQLSQKARLIESVVQKLKELRYPTTTPVLLAEIISKISNRICDTLWEQAQSADPSDNTFQLQLKLAVKVVESLTANLRFVERATTNVTPWSLIQPFEKISEKLHPGCRFIIRPQWKYNFTIVELISQYKKGFHVFIPVDEVINQVLSKHNCSSINSLYVVGFPYLERLSILRHVLFAHEIGHPIEKEYFASHPSGEINRLMDSDVRQDAAALQPAEFQELVRLKGIAETCKAVRHIRQRALAELICDMVCVRLFGPAALFALLELSRTSDLDALSDDPPSYHYPPWRYRLRNAAALITDDWFDQFITQGGFDESTSEKIRNYLRKFVASQPPRQTCKNSMAKWLRAYLTSTLPKPLMLLASLSMSV